jgi:hypothetical protein
MSRCPPPLQITSPPSTAPEPGRIVRRFFSSLSRGGNLLLGFSSIVISLAVISAIPVLNLLSLGYLLEASARVGRSGRLRDGLIGLKRFAVGGRIVLACWLWILPLRLIDSFHRDAELIAPGSDRVISLRISLVVMTLIIGVHLIRACLRGAKWHHFLWPAPLQFLRELSTDLAIAPLLIRVKTFLLDLRLRHFLRLGALGFAGALLWLLPPVLILLLAANLGSPGVAALLSLAGTLILGFVVLYLPFLQTRFAMSGEFRAFFSLSATREQFSRAPLAFWFALFITLLFALPLYLLKIELTPNEVAWLPNLVFVLFIFPARLLLGWALSRAEKQALPRAQISRWLARLAAVPVVATYAFVVWLSQYLSWHGSLGLLEQHAFLVPAPLLGL